ncbi:MAG: diaminopimelate epimerase [Nitrospiraceae bacterium]|nr:MAG: diaminopimelate epimerase [Nitrospiraceae bacterium]
MKLQFTKMHSLGNDFIVIDNRPAKLRNLPKLARYLCNRRFGVGADQMLLLCSSSVADYKMRIMNADGSEVEMCGNGIRCFGKFIWESAVSNQQSAISRTINDTNKKLSIETLGGIKHLRKIGELVEVDMGEPIFDPAQIPLKVSSKSGDIIINYPLKVKDKTLKITCVSMGNPHAVIFVKDVQAVALQKYGPLIEHHRIFPRRINVEFIQVLNKSNIKMRVWERGAGETLACGTGASASAVASILHGLTGRKITVHLPGGKLIINWAAKDNHVYMTGDAVKVFEGEVEI